MTLIFCDGVDDGLGNLGKWDLAYGDRTYVDSGGRNTNCYRMQDFQSGGGARGIVKRGLGSDQHATLIVGCALKVNDLSAFGNTFAPSAGHINIHGDNGATHHLSCLLAGGNPNTDARVQVFRGYPNGGTLIYDKPVSAWLANNWYYVELKVVASNTVGSVEVKLNGTSLGSVGSLDTLNGGTETVFDAVSLCEARGANNGWYVYFDDIYICNGAGSINNDFLGDIAVETLYPSGDGSSSQWVGSDGNSVNNSLLVDEAAPDTADYVQSATAGNRDLYAYGNLSRGSGTIYGIIATALAKKSDSGAVSLKNAVKSGSTVLASAAQALATTFVPVSSVFETNPDTSAAWTVSEVNGMEAGVEVA